MRDELLARIEKTNYSENHAESWRNEVAKDMNTLLGRAQYELETDGCDVDLELAESALRLCQRVAEFEGIKLT